MDSPYLFHDNSMVFHAPVQRRPAAPQGHGGRAQPQPQRLAPPHREDQLLSRRALIGYASPRQDDERSYSPLPALPTVLRARNHLQPTPGQGQLSPLVAPPPAPAFLAPSYRPLTLARTTSASTKNALGFILDGSRARRDPFPPHEDRKGYHHEDTHSFHLHPDEIHRIPRMRDERSFKEEEEYPPFAASRYGTGGSHFPPRREDARGRLVSDDFADSSSYTSSPMPVTTARRSSSASVRPLDMPSAPAATESTKKKRKARICTTEGCTKYVVDHGLCIRHGGGKRCYIDGCDCRAQNRGLCWKHGGFTICKIDGCTKRAKSRGICWSHGGGTRCKRDDCSKIAVSNGLCWAHGGGKRCVFGKCRKPASERTNNFCNEHHAQETEV